MHTLTIRTSARDQLIDITQLVQNAVDELGLQDGVLVLHCPHTTAGITINEGADPSVAADIQADLLRLFPREQSYYRHAEGNSSSHVRASVVGNSSHVIVAAGRMVLGTWQAIFFCEFDGPRTRRLMLQPLAQAQSG